MCCACIYNYVIRIYYTWIVTFSICAQISSVWLDTFTYTCFHPSMSFQSWTIPGSPATPAIALHLQPDHHSQPDNHCCGFTMAAFAWFRTPDAWNPTVMYSLVSDFVSRRKPYEIHFHRWMGDRWPPFLLVDLRVLSSFRLWGINFQEHSCTCLLAHSCRLWPGVPAINHRVGAELGFKYWSFSFSQPKNLGGNSRM